MPPPDRSPTVSTTAITTVTSEVASATNLAAVLLPTSTTTAPRAGRSARTVNQGKVTRFISVGRSAQPAEQDDGADHGRAGGHGERVRADEPVLHAPQPSGEAADDRSRPVGDA